MLAEWITGKQLLTVTLGVLKSSSKHLTTPITKRVSPHIARLLANYKSLDEPAHQELLRAVRKSYLKATLKLCEARRQELKDEGKDEGSDNERRWLTQVESFCRNDLYTPKVASYFASQSQAFAQPELLFQPEAAGESLKKELLTELSAIGAHSEVNPLGLYDSPIPDRVRAMIESGWREPGSQAQRDWFELLSAYFIEELSQNDPAATIFQSQLLAGVSVNDQPASLAAIKTEVVQQLDETVLRIEQAVRHEGALTRQELERMSEQLTSIAAAAQQPAVPSPSLTPDRFQTLLADYIERCKTQVGAVRLFGDAERRELDLVFVELTLNEEYDHHPDQAAFRGLMDAELRRMRSVFDAADEHRDREEADDPANHARVKAKRTIKPDELLSHTKHTVITGAPGCGKTTLLHYLAWQTLKQWRAAADRFSNEPGGDQISADHQAHARFPVFLEFKRLDEHTCQGARNTRGQLDFARLLFNQAIAQLIPGAEEHEYEALFLHFRAWLSAGKVAIFLDGLDEVNGRQFFTALRESVNTFLTAYGTNTVIISTRPFALSRFADAKEMEILPLNQRQIEQFIAHYYGDLPARQQFQRELQRRRELRELARVPALLGFILQLWRKRGSVPDDKLDLYEQVTRELAAQLDREKEGIALERKWLVADPDGSLKLDLLRQIAFHQLFRGLIYPPYEIGNNTNDVTRLVFTSEQLRAEAAAFAHAIKEREGITINPRHLAEDVKVTAMLRQVGTDHYAFAHLTLQEYLAAWQLAKRQDADTCERIFCRAYFNPTLAEREVLPMTLGLTSEADKLYAALDLLPETPLLLSLRLHIRGVGYGASISDNRFTMLLDRIHRILGHPSNTEQSYRRPILRSLWFLPTQAQEYLEEKIIQDLSDLSSFNSEHAAENLTVLGSEKAFLPLVKVLNPRTSRGLFSYSVIGYPDVEESRTNYVCRALARINPKEAVPILASISTSYSYGEIDRILRQIGTEESFKALLVRSTRSAFGDIARAAKELLVQCENSGVEDVLVNALKHNRNNFRELAVEILGRIEMVTV